MQKTENSCSLSHQGELSLKCQSPCQNMSMGLQRNSLCILITPQKISRLTYWISSLSMRNLSKTACRALTFTCLEFPNYNISIETYMVLMTPRLVLNVEEIIKLVKDRHLTFLSLSTTETVLSLPRPGKRLEQEVYSRLTYPNEI